MLSDDTLKKLARPLDRSLVKTRTERGKTLSYLSHHTVIRELNECFRVDGWSFYLKQVTPLPHVQKTDFNGNEQVVVGFQVEGRLTLHAPGDIVQVYKTSEDVGYAVAFGKPDSMLGLIEQAGKSASSDCLKRCAFKLSDQFGLALYDKDQERVADTSKNVAAGDMNEAKVKAIQAATTAEEVKAIYRAMAGSERPLHKALVAERVKELS